MTQERGQARLPEQQCPLCGIKVRPNARYPRYLCRACAARARSEEGRPLEFFNVSMSGGFAARYGDTREAYPSQECFVDGVRCFAGEARFGGIVIQVSDDT